jgi:hypothetical protein
MEARRLIVSGVESARYSHLGVQRYGASVGRPMLECNPGKAIAARELHEAVLIVD